MRTTQTVVIPKTITLITCDVCQQDTNSNRKCHVCKKDLCNRCGRWWAEDPFDGADNGDYPPSVCPDCDNTVREVGAKCRAINEKAWNEVEALKAEWFKSREELGPKTTPTF